MIYTAAWKPGLCQDPVSQALGGRRAYSCAPQRNRRPGHVPIPATSCVCETIALVLEERRSADRAAHADRQK